MATSIADFRQAGPNGIMRVALHSDAGDKRSLPVHNISAAWVPLCVGGVYPPGSGDNDAIAALGAYSGQSATGAVISAVFAGFCEGVAIAAVDLARGLRSAVAGGQEPFFNVTAGGAADEWGIGGDAIGPGHADVTVAGGVAGAPTMVSALTSDQVAKIQCVYLLMKAKYLSTNHHTGDFTALMNRLAEPKNAADVAWSAMFDAFGLQVSQEAVKVCHHWVHLIGLDTILDAVCIKRAEARVFSVGSNIPDNELPVLDEAMFRRFSPPYQGTAKSLAMAKLCARVAQEQVISGLVLSGTNWVTLVTFVAQLKTVPQYLMHHTGGLHMIPVASQPRKIDVVLPDDVLLENLGQYLHATRPNSTMFDSKWLKNETGQIAKQLKSAMMRAGEKLGEIMVAPRAVNLDPALKLAVEALNAT